LAVIFRAGTDGQDLTAIAIEQDLNLAAQSPARLPSLDVEAMRLKVLSLESLTVPSLTEITLIVSLVPNAWLGGIFQRYQPVLAVALAIVVTLVPLSS
jgi:hypothetical protein